MRTAAALEVPGCYCRIVVIGQVDKRPMSKRLTILGSQKRIVA